MGEIKYAEPNHPIRTWWNDLVCALLATLNTNGTIKKIFGDWETKSFDTKYQAPTDGIIQAWSHSSGSGHDTRLLGATSPDDITYTYRGASTAIGSDIIADTYDGFSMPVKKGEYWYVEKLTVGGPFIGYLYWRPIGEA